MSSRLSSVGCLLALSVLAASGPGVNRAQAQGTPYRRDTGLSESKSMEMLTNLTAIKPHQGVLRDFEKQLGKGSNPLGDGGELDFPVPQYIRPSSSSSSALNKRVKEILDQRNNWMRTPDFVGPNGGSVTSKDSKDDPYASRGLSSDDPFQNQSSLEQFREALKRQENEDPKSNSQPDRQDREHLDLFDARRPLASTLEFDREDTSKLPSGIREGAEQLRKTLSDDGSAPTDDSSALGRSSISDFFGLGSTPSSTHDHEQMLIHRTVIQDYSNIGDKDKLWSISGGTPVGAAFDPLKPMLSTVSPAYTSGFESLARPLSPKAEVTMPEPSPLASPLSAVTMPDLSPPALNQWSPSFAPRIEPPKLAPALTPPSMDFPRRKF